MTALRPRPMSTNAASIDGSTFCTLPRKTLPISESAPGLRHEVLDQDAVLEQRDLGQVAALTHRHDPFDGFAPGQELGLGQDLRAAPGRNRGSRAGAAAWPPAGSSRGRPGPRSSTRRRRPRPPDSRTCTTVLSGSSSRGVPSSPDVRRRRRRRRRLATAAAAVLFGVHLGARGRLGRGVLGIVLGLGRFLGVVGPAGVWSSSASSSSCSSVSTVRPRPRRPRRRRRRAPPSEDRPDRDRGPDRRAPRPRPPPVPVSRPRRPRWLRWLRWPLPARICGRPGGHAAAGTAWRAPPRPRPPHRVGHDPRPAEPRDDPPQYCHLLCRDAAGCAVE